MMKNGVAFSCSPHVLVVYMCGCRIQSRHHMPQRLILFLPKDFQASRVILPAWYFDKIKHNLRTPLIVQMLYLKYMSVVFMKQYMQIRVVCMKFRGTLCNAIFTILWYSCLGITKIYVHQLLKVLISPSICVYSHRQ